LLLLLLQWLRLHLRVWWLDWLLALLPLLYQLSTPLLLLLHLQMLLFCLLLEPLLQHELLLFGHNWL
jgi:hypothetical protein